MDLDFLVDIEQLKVDMTIKARREEGGKFYRADVIDLAVMRKEQADGRESIKVHWWGTKPSIDKWVKLEDCRFISQFHVNWEEIKEKLPLEQDPESRARRKKVFEEWNTGGNPCALTKAELEEGTRRLFAGDVGEDVEEAAKATVCAWKVSRALAPAKKKGAGKSVDIKEFHAFVVAFRCYLELAHLFEHLDRQEDDQKLSLRECRKGMEKLTKWGISESVLSEKFEGMDVWTPKWKFEDFAKFCIEKRWQQMTLDLELDSDDDEVQMAEAEQNVRAASGGVDNLTKRQRTRDMLEDRSKIMEQFKKWDSDYSGKISEAELVAVLAELNPDMSPDIARLLIRRADANKDGEIDYEEFTLWLLAESVDEA